jgi:transcriptional regulator with XRE-family HTH domain
MTPDAEPHPGALLAAMRDSAGLSQREAAERLGVHFTTWNRYEKGKQKVPAELLMRAQRELVKSLAAPAVSVEPATVPRVSAGLPQTVRVWLQRELLEYAEAGVSDEDLNTARQLYESPEVNRMFVGGVPVARTPEAVLKGMRAIAVAVRSSLRERGYAVAPDTAH